MSDTPTDEIPITALLRAARGAYGIAVREQLAAAGFEDLPLNGPYVLGGLVNRGGSAGDLIRQLGVSKQAASQLIDTLVVRGYLERSEDSHDRRRTTLVATRRGRDAAAATLAGVEEIDRELAEMLAPESLDGLRQGLIALTAIRERREEAFRDTGGPAAPATG
jgi:DNA-binding MarR family transcriptional regulator